MTVRANRLQPRKNGTGNRVPLDGKPSYLQLVTRIALEIEISSPRPIVYAPGCALDVYLSGSQTPSTTWGITLPLRGGDAERLAACAAVYGRGGLRAQSGGAWLARYALARWIVQSDPLTVIPPAAAQRKPSDVRRAPAVFTAISLSPVALAGVQYLARVIARQYRPRGTTGVLRGQSGLDSLASPGGWLAAVLSAEIRRLALGDAAVAVKELTIG